MDHLAAMNVPVSEAKARLTDLVRRAEAGEEVVLTRRGAPAVRLTACRPSRKPTNLLAILDEISRRAAAKATPGPCAARSQDFLYDDEFGLPR